MVAHLVLDTIGEAEQLWLDFRVEWRHKSKVVSTVVHSLQAHLIHSVMTLFLPAPRSSSFSRSLADSSCPNHRTPCWGTVERYKDTISQIHPCSCLLSLSLPLSHFDTHIETSQNKAEIFSILSARLSIHLSKLRSLVCQWIAVRNRQESLTTMVRGTQFKSVRMYCPPCFCTWAVGLFDSNLMKSSFAVLFAWLICSSSWRTYNSVQV